MAVKRRVIWMSDEEWTVLVEWAKAQGITVSSAIRQLWQVAAKRGAK